MRHSIRNSASVGRACAIALSITGLLCVAASTASASPKRVHLSGTAYAFDDQAPIAGAKIRVAELPGAKATTAADGTYDLVVPDGARVTPYIHATGFHGIYLQTLITTGRNLQRVNFQVPSVDIYHLLALVLGVELNADDNPKRCVIVSTFSTANVRGLSFADFVGYGAHGVAGATASASPALADPVYFNSSVIPDASLTESSIDGGVIWLDVPGGVYRLRAQHPTTRFASFIATCKPGRLVNANPPQGLYELKPGEKPDNRVQASLASTRVRTGSTGKAILDLKLRAGEYVLPDARLLRAGKQVAAERPARYADGGQTLSVELGRKLAAGPLALRLSVSDAAGNTKLIKRTVSPPR